MSELLDGYHPATIAGKLPPADEEDVWCYVNINGYWCRFYDLKDRAFCLHRTISDYCYYYNLPSSFRLVDKYNQFPISEYTKEELMTFGSLDGIPGPTKNFGELLYEHDTINGKHLHLQFETKGLHTLVVATRLFSLLQTKPLGMFETSQVAGERSAVVSKHYLLKICLGKPSTAKVLPFKVLQEVTRFLQNDPNVAEGGCPWAYGIWSSLGKWKNSSMQMRKWKGDRRPKIRGDTPHGPR